MTDSHPPSNEIVARLKLAAETRVFTSNTFADIRQLMRDAAGMLAAYSSAEPGTLRPGLERAIEILSKADCYTAHGATASGLITADVSTEHVQAFRDHMIDKLDEAIGSSALPPPDEQELLRLQEAVRLLQAEVLECGAACNDSPQNLEQWHDSAVVRAVRRLRVKADGGGT